MGSRDGKGTLMLKGIFKGARVERGEDWEWKDQDGGKGMAVSV